MNKAMPSRLTQRLGVATIFLCVFLANSASAQTGDKYLTYTADINGDGRLDILVKPVAKTIMLAIDDDLTFPITVSPAMPSFLLVSNASGNYQLSTNLAQAAPSTSWTPGLVSVTTNSGQASNGTSVTVSYVNASQLPSIVSKASNGALELTQSGPAPLINDGPTSGYMCPVW